MLTLEEAVAWLDKMLELHLKPCGEPDCGECLRDTRAAVRDVALALRHEIVTLQCPPGAAPAGCKVAICAECWKAEINRLFPHG